jgi:prepilin-type N-terminal cleavage/methylation domain-containing protein
VGKAAPGRSGFTLVELMVVVSILLVLTAMTFTAINVTMNTDRVRAAARQIQSYTEGARDRAIYAGEPRGVRFLLNATDLTASSSLVFVGAPEKFTDNWITVEAGDQRTLSGGYSIVDVDIAAESFSVRGDITASLTLGNALRVDNSTGNDGPYTVAAGSTYDAPNNVTIVNVAPVNPPTPLTWPDNATSDGVLTLVNLVPFWDDLRQRGLLSNGARIKLEDSTYSIAHDGNGWLITKNYSGTTDVGTAYELELQPVPLPDQEPRLLPRGIVVDLDHSDLPSSWASAYFDHDSNAATPDIRTYSGRMDVMFSPSGSVTGDEAVAGLIHFLLADVTDVEQFRVPGHPYREQDERVATLTPQTGNVATSEVFRAGYWTANTSYDVGDWVVPPDEDDFDQLLTLDKAFERCTKAGTSGAIEPIWTGAPPVMDGTAEWTQFTANEYGTPDYPGTPGFVGPILRFATGDE